jgi:hypothetical protein
MGINSLHFPDDCAAGAQIVSTVDIGQLKLAIDDDVVARSILRCRSLPCEQKPFHRGIGQTNRA